MTSAHSDRVAGHFETDWTDYDRQIRIVVPFYDQAMETLVAVVGHNHPRPLRILDLGIGTGRLAELLLAEFPDAHITGVDLLESYLERARSRLSKYAGQVSLLRGDVADFEFSASYDLIVTSFVFHHLEDEVKRKLYARTFTSLSPGGCFVNADFVDSGSRFYGRVFDDLRIAFMREHGWTEDAIRSQYTEHRALEIPAPMAVQLEWLTGVGFWDVECFWKYLNLAVFGGRKPSSADMS